MFFPVLFVMTVIGYYMVRWAMRGAYTLGHNDFAFGMEDPFTWITYTFYEAVSSAGVFCGIYFANSLLDLLMGNALPLTPAHGHLVSDALFAILVAQILLAAMIIEGMRIRRHYYQFVAPLRSMYLSFRKHQLVRPSFSELYRLW